MTLTKSKFDPFLWLVHTQYVELCKADTEHQRANEAADMIAVCIQLIEDLGYDAGEIFSKRADEKAPDFKAIKRKYDERFKSVIEELDGTR